MSLKAEQGRADNLSVFNQAAFQYMKGTPHVDIHPHSSLTVSLPGQGQPPQQTWIPVASLTSSLWLVHPSLGLISTSDLIHSSLALA